MGKISKYVLGAFLLLVCFACGGGGSGGGTETGSITVSALWSNDRSRIPTATNYLVVDLIKDGNVELSEQVTRPTNPGTTVTQFSNLGPGNYLIRARGYESPSLGVVQASASVSLGLSSGQSRTTNLSLDSAVSRIILSGAGNVQAGSTLELAASGVDSSGVTVLTNPQKWAWTSSNTANVSLSSSSSRAPGYASSVVTATGQQSGSSTITALNQEEGLSASVTVTSIAALSRSGFFQVGANNGTTLNLSINPDGSFSGVTSPSDGSGYATGTISRIGGSVDVKGQINGTFEGATLTGRISDSVSTANAVEVSLQSGSTTISQRLSRKSTNPLVKVVYKSVETEWHNFFPYVRTFRVRAFWDGSPANPDASNAFSTAVGGGGTNPIIPSEYQVTSATARDAGSITVLRIGIDLSPFSLGQVDNRNLYPIKRRISTGGVRFVDPGWNNVECVATRYETDVSFE